jgi:mannose-1-phosphate guanylyltransferase
MNRPLLERKLGRAARSGIRRAILSTGYKSDIIETYFSQHPIKGMQVLIKKELSPLGTGGAIRNAAAGLSDDFFVFNADILEGIDLAKMARCHRQMHADVTIAVKRVEDVRSFGVIEQRDGYAHRFIEKPQAGETSSHLINAGTYIFSPEVISLIARNQAVSVERDVFPLLLERGKKIAVYPIRSYWRDIGNPEDYLRVHADIMKGLYRIPEVDYRSQQVYCNGIATTYQNDMMRGPVYIGKNVQIGPGAVIGPYACIGDNCHIPSGCRVGRSLLWKNVHLGRNEQTFGSIVTPSCRIDGLEDVFGDVKSSQITDTAENVAAFLNIE